MTSKRRKQSEEYKKFLWIRHWIAYSKVLRPSKLVDKKDPLYPLFVYLYSKTRELYKQLPFRKNGEDSFIHPINLVGVLTASDVNDMTTLCAALVHDFVEEEVDLHKKRNKLKEDKRGIEVLDKYELKVFEEFENDLNTFCKENNLDNSSIKKIIGVTRLLTRHKRDFYYRSICHIFDSKDDEIQEKAIQVKLADRTHNILSIECFTEQERIYQCFKNLFILNSTKRYLISQFGPQIFKNKDYPTVILFKRCGKATFDAFQSILELANVRGVGAVKTLLQLAFKKYALEYDAVKEVTAINKKETHPIRLYQGVIRKYDARLYHKWDLLDDVKKEEFEYVKNFFAGYNFNKEQLNTILEYKDAYSLKEVIAYLMYVPDYFIAGFDYNNLFKENKK